MVGGVDPMVLRVAKLGIGGEEFRHAGMLSIHKH